MIYTKKRFPCWPVLCLLASSTGAQVISPTAFRGPFSGLANGMSIAMEDQVSGEANLIKPPGDQTSMPRPWSSEQVAGAQYDIQLMFPGLYPLVQFDAVSTGNDYVPTYGGEISLSSAWAAMMISVSNKTTGQPGNPWLAERRSGAYSSRTTPGADVATHFAEGSTGIGQALLGNTVIAHLGEQAGLAGDQEIDGLDLAMGVMPSSSGIASTLLFTRNSDFYFSLTPESAILLLGVLLAFDENLMTYVPVDPASVYRVDWDDQTNTWSQVFVHHTAGELGLDPYVDNVDALAVDVFREKTAFSTQPVPGRPQLQVYEPSHWAPGVYEVITGGDSVDNVFELRPTQSYDDSDDIDAVCFLDPEAGVYDNLIGTQIGPCTYAEIGLSAMCVAKRSYAIQVTDGVPLYQLTTVAGTVAPADVPQRIRLFYSQSYDPTLGYEPTSFSWVEWGSAVMQAGRAEVTLDLPATVPAGGNLFLWAQHASIPDGAKHGSWVLGFAR